MTALTIAQYNKKLSDLLLFLLRLTVGDLLWTRYVSEVVYLLVVTSGVGVSLSLVWYVNK